MSTDPPMIDDELTLEEGKLTPLGPGMPPYFRERLALALKTTAADVLDAAEATYRGLYASGHEYVIEQVSEHLPPFLLWLCPCLDPEKTLIGYEGNSVMVWTIPLDENKVMVFEGVREAWADGGGVRYHAPNRSGTLQGKARS